ncbi:glucose 1-dehydrogenase [Noviherbaspirillum sp. CPCC 100848]|jgi:NAD(P)-dependent dehydrogenase (short-subunit alcohol dehydrogenase family)|uniref:Glucose 1-dehydrogenase n=1 Tax=Noviherbaspirillum album TaxID=3080276 RepID=A0ABU6J3X4_9BURK|nr:glucose 1-dehydrogenase [Noviherbaspirillum sp. CPCC 100848]MEC4718327.1 glucose 1-dehydrogenase [Noviherbaspirillum sp. CPCC 100848]
MRLNNKVAIVTGGANGMGKSIAQLFALEGAKVVVCDVLEDEGTQVVNELKNKGLKAEFIKLNVSQESEWITAIDATKKSFGRIDILVNNAGISGAVPDLMDLAYFDRLWEVNARGTFLGMKYSIDEMAKSGGGAIVNISSVASLVAQPVVHMGYNAAKAGIQLMTRSAAVQFADKGIRVNSVHPGWMPPMRTSAVSAEPGVRVKLLEGVPMQRFGRVEEVANAALFLASDEASYITGTQLFVDGGLTAM